MWEKFKKSAFAERCRKFSKNRGAVITTVCLLIAMTVILSVAIAANRSKKTPVADGLPEASDRVETGDRETVNAPTYNEPEDDGSEVGGEAEDFILSLPVTGNLYKGHDSSVQVWSDTMDEYRIHLGVDIATEAGAPVLAAADGKISRIWNDPLMGRCIAIEHDGEVVTVYKNLSETSVKGIAKDVTVKCGQQIGYVGQTAISEIADDPHLHLELTVGGLSVDPRDYMTDEAKDALSSDGVVESGMGEENETDQNTENGK